MLIVSFDVLALPSAVSDEIGARQPIPEGRRLWNSLFTSYNGRMMVFAAGVSNYDGCLQWLKREGFKASTVDVIADTHVDTKVERIEVLHALYGKVTWYIDVDPNVVAKVSRNGIPTLLVTVPHVVRPEWSEQREKKGWEAVVQEIEAQQLARAERTWNDHE